MPQPDGGCAPSATLRRMVPAIVLAAGASSRMGRPKALLPIDGRPAVEVVCATLAAARVDDIVVVVGRHAAEIRAGADLRGARIVENPTWERGRTSSVQTGIAAIAPAAEWTLLALVDMPFVRRSTVRALLDAAAKAAAEDEVIVPVAKGAFGHPIVLRRALFPRIAALGGDDPLHLVVRGARRVEVPVDDEGVLIDLDTPDDLVRVRKTPR
jgi:molybdenum cofactor cytidylyltransferase